MAPSFSARLEDNVLDKLICHNCQCLLSVPPVLLTENGSICGRCKIDLPSWSTRNIVYEMLASTFVFPCRYVDAGCKKKETFHSMNVHEEMCNFQTVTCSIGDCMWSGILDALILHVCTAHDDALIDIDDKNDLKKRKSLYILEIVGYFFLIEWTWMGTKLEFQMINVGHHHTKTIFVFDVSFYKAGDLENPVKTIESVKLITKENIVFDLEMNSGDLLVSFSINKNEFVNINDDFRNYPDGVLCSRCHQRIPPPVLKCRMDHLFCIKCTDYFQSTCQLCNDNTRATTFFHAHSLDGITLLDQYRCSQCGEFSNVLNFFEHSLNCPKRIYKCPSCNNRWTGLLDEYIDHVRTCRVYVPFNVILEDEVTMSSYDSTSEYRIVTYRNLFTVIFQEDNNGTDIRITSHEPLFLGWFRFVATLYHIKDPYYEFQKKYYCTSRSYNNYLIRIPSADIKIFGELHPFKITLKIYLLPKVLRRISYYSCIIKDLQESRIN